MADARTRTVTRTRLREVAQVSSGLALSRRALSTAAERAVVTVADLRDGFLPPVPELVRMRVALPRRPAAVTIQEGDVLLAARGSQPRVGIADAASAGAIVSANLLLIRPGPALRPEVLLAFLLQPDTQARLRDLGRSSTGQLSLTGEDVGNLEVPVPAAAVQERSAALVRATAAYCRAAESAAAERWQLALALAADAGQGSCSPSPVPPKELRHHADPRTPQQPSLGRR